jgi:hypothetical protein
MHLCVLYGSQNNHRFLGTFEKFRKATISFFISICLPVCPSAWNNLAPTGRIFMKFDIWRLFSKICRENSSLIKIRQLQLVIYIKKNTHFLILSRSFNLRVRNVSDESYRENQNTHFVFSNYFFFKSCLLWGNVETNCRAGQATDGNMAHSHCMLDA